MSQATTNKTKNSSWQWYKNNPEVIEAATFCIVFQLTVTKSVERMKETGYPMDPKTFRRIRVRILKKWEERYHNLMKTDFVPYVFTTYEALKIIEYELWKIVRTSNNPWEKMKALDMLRKTREDQFEILSYPSAIEDFTNEFEKKMGIKRQNWFSKASYVK